LKSHFELRVRVSPADRFAAQAVARPMVSRIFFHAVTLPDVAKELSAAGQRFVKKL
jgi:hypothetical protein